ncbi:hypothetical protein [Microbacterium sp. T2.11-28]|uniref:hypothetical protein n=1 Tax=Microbacterium sp. T2.11-28 TaxID=3041169 RepID=UPI002477B975|nr:hypothetical protein [Microbacterium sp. T2.11-28]CAI9391461.1 hypothetical protein MICABA_01785 [Microbacterium sp. T2.11-28]
MTNRKNAILATVVACALLLSAAPAWAAGAPTERLATASAESASLTALSVPIKGCSTSAWRYDSTSRGTRTLTQIGPTQANRNRTAKSMRVTLTSDVGGTVNAQFSGATNVKGSVKVAEISAEFGVSAGLSVTASVGNSVTFTVPSGKTGYGDYGVWSLPVRGKEYRTLGPDCTIQSRAASTLAPFRVGWDVTVK